MRPRTRRARSACVAAARLTPGGVETAHPLPVLLRAPGPHSIRAVPPPPEPATRGFRRQRRERHQAARRCSRRRSPPRVPHGGGAVAGTRVVSRRRGGPGRRGAARPSAPRANQPDRPSLPMTRRQAALATMGLRVCHGRSQQRHALHRSAGRRVAPRAPRFRPPHSHRDRRRDADKSARGQPRHAATSPTARSISAHFHWRKSVPHPVTEYLHFHGDDANVTALRVVRRLHFVIPNARVLLLRVPMHEEKSARILLNRGSELLGQTSRPRGKSPEICPSDFKSLACQPPHQPLENRYEYRVGRPIGYQCRPQHHSADRVSTGVSGNLGCCMSSRCITLLARAPAAFERIRGTSSLSPMACKGLR